MKKILILLSILGIVFSLKAQKPKFTNNDKSPKKSRNLKKGDYYYEIYSFNKAIKYYERIEKKSEDVTRNMADSYRFMGDLEKAEEHYAMCVQMGDFLASDIYFYATMLRSNGKYFKSEEWMETYFESMGGDSRGKEYHDNRGEYEQLLKDNDRYIIQNLAINSAQEDFGTSYFKDKIVLASSREGVLPIKRTWNWNELPFLDLYLGTPDGSKNLPDLAPFDKSLNNKFHEGPASFTEQGNFMAFTRNNYGGKSSDDIVKLQIFTEEFVDGEWKNEKAFNYNNAEYSVGHPALSKDGLTMYFSSDMPGGVGGVDIYKTTRIDSGWSKPINMGNEINTEGNEMFPFYHEDGFLFFASDGHVGLGGLDNFIALIKEDGSVGKMMNMGYPLNDRTDDFAVIFDNEMKNGYFSSNRPGGKGDDDIYSFEMLKPFVFGKVLKGISKDKKGEVIAVATIILLDSEGNKIGEQISGADGAYSFIVEADKDFNLTGNKLEYFEGTNTANTKTDEEVVIADLVLEHDPGLSLYGLITDKKTGLPLDSVDILLMDNMTGNADTLLTPMSGDFRKPLMDKKLNDRGSYNIVLHRNGYFSKTVTYNVEFDREGQFDVHSDLDLGLDPEVKDLSEMIEINPIKFDLNKFNIRPDAATELDKIVAVMNKYEHMVIELGAHTDCRGSKAYNEKLSDKRAKASASYIKTKITGPERIYGKGYGEKILLNDCACEGRVKSDCEEERHSVNRRTEFKVISTGNDKLKVKNTSTDSFEE